MDLFLKLVDLIAQGHQAIGKMDVFDRHAERLNSRVLAGKIPQAAHAMPHQPLRQRGGAGMWDGQHRDIRLVLVHIGVEFGHIAHGDVADGAPHDRAVAVKRA